MTALELWQSKIITLFNTRRHKVEITKITDVERFRVACFETGAITLKDGEKDSGKAMPKVILNEAVMGGGFAPRADFLEWLKSKTEHVTTAVAVAEEEEDDGAADELQRLRDETKHRRAAMRTLAESGLALAKQERDQVERAERLMREALDAKAKEIRDEGLRLDQIRALPAVQPRPIAPPPAEYERVEMMMHAAPPVAYPAVVANYNQPPPPAYGQPYPASYGQPPPPSYGQPPPPGYGQPLPLFRPPPGGRGQPAPHRPRLENQPYRPPAPRSSIAELVTRASDVGSSIGNIFSAFFNANHCDGGRRK